MIFRKHLINSSRNALIIFTREPEPGRTKTRLMPYFSAEKCASLHCCMLRDIRREMKRADADIVVAYTGGQQGPLFLRKTFGKDTPFIRQRGDDIGARMQNAIADTMSLGYEKVVLIGTDIPEIEAETVDAALAVLDVCDVVLGPTEDGGYYLIGMKKVWPEAFNVKIYGTDTVFNETVSSMKAAGLKVECVDSYSDIDTPDDIEGFRRRMREDALLRYSDTGRFLAANAVISVIVPVYNEASQIEKILGQLRPYTNECEIIIVDGGSTDGTPEIASKYSGVTVLRSGKGRGLQMNTGALASGGDILFFLHCDSVLPAGFAREIRRIMTTRDWGCFGVKFPSRNFFMLTNRLISNHRALVRGVPFGDQGIFIDRTLFMEMGMFPEIPVMEDYEFSLRMKRYGFRPGMTVRRIMTSDRRYGEGGHGTVQNTLGILKTEFDMWRLRAMYRRGRDIDEIADRYRDIR